MDKPVNLALVTKLMGRLGLDDGPLSNDNKDLSASDARWLSIQRCVQSVIHATKCRAVNGCLRSCLRMKRLLVHSKNCKRRQNNGCAFCKQLIALCYIHSHDCKDPRCVIPYCLSIKHKLKQQKMLQRIQKQQMMMRRMQQMNAPIKGATQLSASAPLGAQPALSPVQNPQPGLKPGPLEPPPKILEAVNEVHRQV